MDKSFVKKILAVLLGISLVIMVYETVSAIIGVITLDDLQILQIYLTDLQAFIKWSMVGLICIIIPTLASYVFAFLSKKKTFALISAVLSFFVTICCIVFFSVARSYAMHGFSSSNYAEGVSLFTAYIQIGVASALIGAYFLITLLHRDKKQAVTETAEETEQQAEEVENEEN